MQLDYPINPRRIGLILGSIALYFAAQSLVVEYLTEKRLDHTADRAVILALDLFSVNAERTIPTWYGALLLFFAAALLAFIAHAKRAGQDRYTRYWVGLVVVFLFLSMDEGAVIHEVIADTLQSELDLSGYLTFGWQLVYVPLVIVFALLYLRFLFHLPPRTRYLFMLAGAVYVGGAVVVEGISANQYDLGGGVSFDYLAIATVEELMEMLGVVVLIYTLLAYIVEQQYAFVFRPLAVAPESPHPADSPRRMQRPVIGLAALVVMMNVGLVAWVLSRSPASGRTSEDLSLATQIMIHQLATDDVVVTRMGGIFGPDDRVSLQVAASLLGIFDEVIVVTLGSTETSYALAGDDLPFDQNRLSEILRSGGETEFIIFDTPAVRLIAGAADE